MLSLCCQIMDQIIQKIETLDQKAATDWLRHLANVGKMRWQSWQLLIACELRRNGQREDH